LKVKRNSLAASKPLMLLQAKLPGQVFTDTASLERASIDNLRISVIPDAVIVIERDVDVGIVLKLANQYAIPVIARGAGSSATGSAVPIRKGWVMDLSKLKAIQLNSVSKIVSVGPGVVTDVLQKKMAQKGLFYPPDPSSKSYSTLGGNIACNAGGMRCVKYGVTRDYVLGLEGYLANGEFVQWGLPLKKFVSGFNLKDLWIGSEGMLGVVTKAHLKLLPLPEKRWMGMFAFKNERVALSLVTKILKSGLVPSICEFLDRQSVDCAERFLGKAIFDKQAGVSILMIEFDGTASEIRKNKGALFEIIGESVLDWSEAKTDAAADDILKVRRLCSQSMYSLADTKLNEDVVVPIEKQHELVRYTLELRKEIQLATPTFGHAGDGNLHVHIMYNRSSRSEQKRAQKGIMALMKKVVALGGSITGEHGIGLAKAPFLKLQHSKAEIETMQAIQSALDPKDILNPGKLFEPFEVWDHPKSERRLPWDH
jgi:glycolate oxidase